MVGSINLKAKKFMKIIKNSIVSLFILCMAFTSCTEFVDPVIPFNNLETSVFLRTIARTSISFNSLDLANSRFEITVEAVDSEAGKTIDSVQVRVRHRRAVPGGGNVFIPAAGANNKVNDVLVKSLTLADFKPNDKSRFLRSIIQVSATEILSKLGLSESQILAKDNFEIRLRVKDKFGRVFNDVNAGPDIKGGAFYDSPFLYIVTVN